MSIFHGHILLPNHKFNFFGSFVFGYVQVQFGTTVNEAKLQISNLNLLP